MKLARFPMRGRASLVGVLALVWLSDSMAQAALSPHWLEPVWGTPAHCKATLEALSRNINQPRVDDLIGVGRQLDTGECLVRDEFRASQFYAQAARRGSSLAALRLAALFGAGRGVPQSYANAGAWLAGKGDTDEAIEPWDYSVGLAFTLIATALEKLQFPRDGWPANLELSLALDADARQAGKLWWRFTGDMTAQAEALRRPIGEAFNTAAAFASARMAPANLKYVVAARVTLPIVVRRADDTRFIITEQDLLLR